MDNLPSPAPGPRPESRPSPRPRPRPGSSSSRPQPAGIRPQRPQPLDLPPLEPDQAEPASARFVPDRRYTSLAAGGAVGGIIAALVTGDSAGRVLLGVAALLLLGYVLSDVLFSPRIVASSGGIVIKSPFVRARLRWDEIDEIRAETRFRRGLRSTTLEIDAGRTLAVFSKRALGAEPIAAAALIEAFRPT